MELKTRNRVRAARLKAGMTQEELADAAGLRYSTLVRIDANPTARLSYEIRDEACEDVKSESRGNRYYLNF